MIEKAPTTMRGNGEPTAREIDVLRRLAERKAQIAVDPANLERRRLWYTHDAGAGERPMVLAEIGGLRDPVVPVPDSVLECQTSWARGLERGLRVEIYQFEVLRDDHVVEPCARTNWKVQVSDYGVQVVQHYADNAGHLGARRWDSPVQDLDRDFGKLRPRTFAVDRQATWRKRPGWSGSSARSCRCRFAAASGGPWA